MCAEMRPELRVLKSGMARPQKAGPIVSIKSRDLREELAVRSWPTSIPQECQHPVRVAAMVVSLLGGVAIAACGAGPWALALEPICARLMNRTGIVSCAKYRLPTGRGIDRTAVVVSRQPSPLSQCAVIHPKRALHDPDTRAFLRNRSCRGRPSFTYGALRNWLNRICLINGLPRANRNLYGSDMMITAHLA